MARKLYEKQAIRRRTGALANGVVLKVYTDEAGTVLADVSLTVGGSAIAGSQVTTADIAGLGPASLRFWGPTDGTDTLWLRVPSDASLGVQKIEADTDPRLDALEAGGGGGGIAATVFDAKGDLIAASAADTAARLAAGANFSILTADSTETAGMRWATTNVVYVKDYVPNPDGTTENYTELAAAITAASGKVLEFEQNKTYVHSTALAPLSNTLIRGNGATLKCGASKTGTMASSGRQIEVAARTGVTIEGLKFVAPLTAHGALSGHVATVRLNGSTYCKVRGCTFTSTGVTNGVFVNGANSADNKVEDNYLDAAAITYSEDGASRTTCRGNTVRNAVSNGLSGSGNNGVQDNTDCIVEANHVIDCGHFGIEDVSNTFGTIVRGNVVRGAAAFGISAVGRATLIEGNTVIESGDSGIECGANGTLVQGNSVRWAGGSGTPSSGVIVNGNAGEDPKGVTVKGNYLEHAQSGVQLAGASVLSASIEGNLIVNPIAYGIRTDATAARPLVKGNVIRFTIPSVNNTPSRRHGIFTVHPTPIIGNTIVWESGAAGGTVDDTGIRVGTGSDYSVVEGNLFDAGSVSSPAVPQGISANGATPAGVRVVDNIFLGGATLDQTGLTSFVASGNTGTTATVNTVNLIATDSQVFTAAGTWTKPASAVTVSVVCIGAGGGGGSGRRGAATTIRSGGAGGASGGTTRRTLPASALGTTEAVAVGAVGTGGAAQTVDDNNGAAGTAGGGSSFGTNLIRASGGGAGAAGNTGAAGASTGGTAMFTGANGAASSATGLVGATGSGANDAGGGGGSGGGITTGDAASNGGAGAGRPAGVSTTGGGAAGVSPGGAGGAGTSAVADTGHGGGGGGGGASSVSGAAGAGGVGGNYGAGGGGGGASLNGNNSGAGGNGGAAIVIVTTYF